MSSRNNYEGLEGGMGPTHPIAGKKLQWKKLAIACTTLIALVWFLSPRDGLKFGAQSEPRLQQFSKIISIYLPKEEIVGGPFLQRPR